MEIFLNFWNEFLLFVNKHSLSIIVVIIALCVEFIAKHFKNKNKNIILTQYGESFDQENNEFYLQYYQKNQILDFIRVISTIFMLFSLFVINTNIGLGFFSVAVGAFVMAFKDYILSVLAFFFVTPSYPIGSTVRVGGVQGQIIFIRMLSVGIIGKSPRGENTGELFLVPNHKFLSDVVQKQELRPDSIFKDEIEIPYNPENFRVPLDEFLKELRAFLSENFPIKNANNVGNFITYKGHKFKLDFYFHEDKYTAILVKFVGKIKENQQKKEMIVKFVDTFMKREEKNNSENNLTKKEGDI